MPNERGSLEWSISHLMPASIQWLIDRGHITRSYESDEQVISLTKAGETYFNALQPTLNKGGG